MMKETMEKVHEVIKNDSLVPDLAINEFHPVKIVEVIELKLSKYCLIANSTPASLANELKVNNSKLCSADMLGLSLAARDIVADSVLNFSKSEKWDTVTLNIATTNLEARVKALEERAHYNYQCINYLSNEVMQLKINSTKVELDKAKKF